MSNKPQNTTKFGKGNPGKPKGALNRTTRSVKEAIELAAEGLGGATRLQAWAASDPLNERVFWGQIYPKLLPLQVQGDPANPISVSHGIETAALTLLSKIRGT